MKAWEWAEDYLKGTSWEVSETTNTLPMSGCPSKLGHQRRMALVREATVMPTATLGELQKLVAANANDVNGFVIPKALHKKSIYGRVIRNKPQLFKKSILTHEDCQLSLRRYSHDVEGGLAAQ